MYNIPEYPAFIPAAGHGDKQPGRPLDDLDIMYSQEIPQGNVTMAFSRPSVKSFRILMPVMFMFMCVTIPFLKRNTNLSYQQYCLLSPPLYQNLCEMLS